VIGVIGEATAALDRVGEEDEARFASHVRGKAKR